MRILVMVLSGVFLCAGGVLADSSASSNTPPPAGETLPVFELPAPEEPSQRAYLGLATPTPFTIGDIEARLVIIEIFSMY